MDENILEQLRRYLHGRMSLTEFEDWFVPATWQIHKAGDRNAVAVARTINLRLAEYLNGHWTEDELKSRLSEVLIARMTPITVFITSARVEGSTTILESEETSSYDLPHREVSLGIGPGRTPQELVPLPSKAEHTLRIDTGRRLPHRD